MITVRHSEDRGRAEFDWLDSRHSFSFADYYDPAHMGFASLRVINQDTVQTGKGFATHGHRDMEIVSYVLDGALEHKDNMGNGSVIRPGDVQRMSAGTGVMHSEYNPSDADFVHFFQIWILPERQGDPPGYEQKTFPDEEKRGQLRLVGSRDGRDGSITIHQDVDLYASLLAAGESVSHRLAPGRKAWVQVARGAIEVNGAALAAGDGAAIAEEDEIILAATDPSEFLLFDMA